MHLALPYEHYVSSLVILPLLSEQLRAAQLPLSLGINNGIHLQPLPLYANLISETNLFGMAVQAIDLNSCLGNTDLRLTMS